LERASKETHRIEQKGRNSEEGTKGKDGIKGSRKPEKINYLRMESKWNTGKAFRAREIIRRKASNGKIYKKRILIHGKKTWQVRGSIQLVGNQLRICFAVWRFSDE
jgi:hypothetical protein